MNQKGGLYLADDSDLFSWMRTGAADTSYNAITNLHATMNIQRHVKRRSETHASRKCELPGPTMYQDVKVRCEEMSNSHECQPNVIIAAHAVDRSHLNKPMKVVQEKYKALAEHSVDGASFLDTFPIIDNF